jgi:hypothetical protein
MIEVGCALSRGPASEVSVGGQGRASAREVGSGFLSLLQSSIPKPLSWDATITDPLPLPRERNEADREKLACPEAAV